MPARAPAHQRGDEDHGAAEAADEPQAVDAGALDREAQQVAEHREPAVVGLARVEDVVADRRVIQVVEGAGEREDREHGGDDGHEAGCHRDGQPAAAADARRRASDASSRRHHQIAARAAAISTAPALYL